MADKDETKKQARRGKGQGWEHTVWRKGNEERDEILVKGHKTEPL